MKQLSTLLLALFMCLTLVACGESSSKISEERNAGASQPIGNDTGSDEANEEAVATQIQLIADQAFLWQSHETAELYGYSVTDLDNNGRLEIISSSCQGTGIYTYSDIWEVNEALDGLILCEQEKEEGSSQADIMVQSVPVYYDSNHDVYYYIFDDLIKNGAAEYYENKRAISLQNGQVRESFLAYKTTIYVNSNPTVTYTDADDSPISEEDYDRIADKIFENMEKKQAKLQWAANESAQLQTMSESELYTMLEESYEAFSIGILAG